MGDDDLVVEFVLGNQYPLYGLSTTGNSSNFHCETVDCRPLSFWRQLVEWIAQRADASNSNGKIRLLPVKLTGIALQEVALLLLGESVRVNLRFVTTFLCATQGNKASDS